jgi:hypothetical protein
MKIKTGNQQKDAGSEVLTISSCQGSRRIKVIFKERDKQDMFNSKIFN